MTYKVEDAVGNKYARETLLKCMNYCYSFDEECVILESMGAEGTVLKKQYIKFACAFSEIAELACRCRKVSDFKNKVYNIAKRTPYSDFEELCSDSVSVRSAYEFVAACIMEISNALFTTWQEKGDYNEWR